MKFIHVTRVRNVSWNMYVYLKKNYCNGFEENPFMQE